MAGRCKAQAQRNWLQLLYFFKEKHSRSVVFVSRKNRAGGYVLWARSLDNQGRMGHASSMSAEIDSKLLEVALNARKFGNLKEGTSENSPCQNEEMGKSKGKAEMSRSPSESLREVNKDVQNVETSGSDASSTGGKNYGEQVLYNGGFSKLADRIKEGTFRRVEENEKTTNREEKQQRKRKRNIMNDKQITIIEKALLEEPDMQRNAASLQSWADKLSAHGSDLTASQLKN